MLNNSFETTELYDVCKRCKSELEDYAGYLSELLVFFEECQMVVPSEPAKIVDGIIIEQEGPVERGIYELSEYMSRIEYFRSSLYDYIDQVIKSIEKEEQLNDILAKTKRLLSDLSERFPTSRETEYLKYRLIDCKTVLDYWCNQKWQGGKSRVSVDVLENLENQYNNQITRSVEEMKYALESYRYKLEETKHRISVACEYASSEIMKDISVETTNEQTYPYIHSISEDENDVFMEEIYGSPQMIMDYQNNIENNTTVNNSPAFCMYCGKPNMNRNNACLSCGQFSIITDPDTTSQFCTKCAKPIPVIAKYCIFCGNHLRVNNISESPISSMACVYASPERMQSKEEKESFFKKIFKRN